MWVQLLGTTVLLAAVLTVVVAGIASASAPTEGQSVPDSAVPVGTFAANTPFQSGQGINVVLPANSLFSPNTNLAVEECAAPNGVIPTLPAACDGTTINGPTLKPNADGSVNFQAEVGSLYTVYALPDSISLGESPTGSPVCGNTAATECILYIGDNQNDFTKPHLWSQPFFIDTNATDSGTPAGDGSAPPTATTPSATLSTAAASPTMNVANGADVSEVTVTLLGTGSVPVPNKTVQLNGTGHSKITPETTGSNVTNALGVATFSVSDATAETVTYTATDTTDSVTVAQQPTVDFAAPVVTDGNSSVSAKPVTVASGSSTTITVTIQDQGSPPGGVAGQTVSLAGSGSTVVITPATTGSNVTNSAGVATFTATDTANESVTFTATDDTDSDLVLTSTAQVTFGTLTVSPAESTVTASSPEPVGAGTTVTVTLLTAGGSPVSSKSVSLATQGTQPASVTISGSPATTDANGQATFTVTDSAAESDTFVATDVTDSITFTQTATITFQTPVPSAAKSTVTADNSTSVADGQTLTLVKITINDQFGKAEANKTVTLAVTGSAEAHPISQGGSTPGETDSTGTAYFEVDDTAAEVVTLTATDTTDNFKVTQTAMITFTAGVGDPDAGSSTVVPSNANPPADGSTSTTITVTLTDEFGNAVVGQTISLTALPAGNKAVITSVSPVTNSGGEATFTATDGTAEVVTFQAVDVTDSNTALAREGVVTFGSPPVPPPLAAFSSVVATPTTVPADGATTSTISVLLYNSNGDAVPGKAVTLTASGGNSTVTAVNATTTNTGNALFTVSDATAESVTFTADDTTDGVNLSGDQATVQFTAVSGSTTTTTTTTTGSGSTTTTTTGSGSTTSTTTTTTTPGSTTTTTDSGSAAGTDASSTDDSSGGSDSSGGADSSGGSLAVTGAPPLLPWLVGAGVVLVGAGSLGRRRHSARFQ